MTTDGAINRTDLKGSEYEQSYSGVLSFFRRKYQKDLEGVDLAVWGVPYDLSTTNRSGTRLGPRSIRAASSIQSWDPAWWWGFDPFDKLAVVDYGDCEIDHGKPAIVPARIEEQAREILDTGTALLSLGGDHFISYPLIKAHHAVKGKLALIHFDAHCDTFPEEDGFVDHGSMFYYAVKEGLIDPAKSVQIGIRTTYPDTMGIRQLDARWVHKHGVEATIAAIKETVGGASAYLTFDIDCLDPAFAPGTGTPVAGGLSSREALEIICGMKGINVVGMDVVEVAPAYDVGEITSLAAATIALNLIGLYSTNIS